MTKAETAALATMIPEQLIEGFVRESKLYQLSDVAEANKALERATGFVEEISRRGGLPSLTPLMGNSDHFIAYSAADRLADLPEFRERALAVLDRIAEMNVGFASSRADIARNMVRYGNPDGDPAVVEKRLAAIRARYDRG